MKQQFWASALLAIWLFASTAPYLFFQAGIISCHTGSFSGPDRNAAGTSETRLFVFTNASEIHWKIRGREIEINHRLYDVECMFDHHNRLFLKCHRDTKEERLFAHMNQLTRERSGRDHRNPVKAQSVNFIGLQPEFRHEFIQVSYTNFFSLTEKPVPGCHQGPEPPPKV